MTREEIIRMAREAQLGTSLTHKGGEQRVWIEGADWHDELERFAALVAEHERDACAKLVEADGLARGSDGLIMIKAAGRIRARGEK